MSGSSFVAIDDGRCAFADLDGLHPRSGNILESEVLCESSYGGCVLLNELHVGAVKSEQSYLFGSGSGISVRHINRGTGFEGFGQIAARGTTELLGIDFLRIEGVGATFNRTLTALNDLYFLNTKVVGVQRILGYYRECHKRQHQYNMFFYSFHAAKVLLFSHIHNT